MFIIILNTCQITIIKEFVQLLLNWKIGYYDTNDI